MKIKKNNEETDQDSFLKDVGVEKECRDGLCGVDVRIVEIRELKRQISPSAVAPHSTPKIHKRVAVVAIVHTSARTAMRVC